MSDATDPLRAISATGEILLREDFATLDRWHLEGATDGVSLTDGALKLDCTGSKQGGVGVHAFYRDDLPDGICLSYDLVTEATGGLSITFLALRGLRGEDGISDVPPREGIFADYVGADASTRSYHTSLSRYNDRNEHTGVSNWRRNPGLHLVGQAEDPCKEPGKRYRVSLIKDGPLCQCQVDGQVASGFVDPQELDLPLPDSGKIGFRAIGSEAIFRVSTLEVQALR